MIKHVNFTGRRRIPRSCVEVMIYDETPRRFDATIDLTSTTMPAEGKLYLEAMCTGSPVIQRFSCGTVANAIPPTKRVLDQIDGERIFFALKVVDESQWMGRLLGLAENIQPKQAGKKTDKGRRGILPILPAPLGQELWRLDFGAHEVCLLVNGDVPGLKDRMRWDPILQAAIYPAAVRIILAEAMERGATDDDGGDDWPTLWLRFASALHPERDASPTNEGHDDWQEWIDEVVGEFAANHKLMDNFSKRLAQSDGDES